MSEKKFVNRTNTPGASIRAPKPGKTPTFRTPANRTIQSADQSQSSINLTITKPKLNAPDWDLECTLSYNGYLQAIANQYLTKKTIKEYEESIDCQISQQTKWLRKALIEKHKLSSELEDIQLEMEIKNQSAKLDNMFIELNKLLIDCNVMQNFESYIEFAETASNRLYLENIKPFKTQAEYDKFSLLINECGISMEKLKNVIDNPRLTVALGVELERYIKLRSDFLSKQNMMSDLLSHISLLMYKDISDKFADLEEDED